MDVEESWKQLKLSLERPYKDEQGNPLPTLFDLTSEDPPQYIYEELEEPKKLLGDNLRRIFIERGHDFFDKDVLKDGVLIKDEDEHEEAASQVQEDASNAAPKIMTVEELFKLRLELLPHLHIAIGEMSQARDLLTMLLSSTPNVPSQAPVLSASLTSVPDPITSVKAFNLQLAICGKDLALRKASDLFKLAADGVERARIRSERYWADALKIRRANWGLIPAPLPFGSATGKGADKTARDFLVSYGLEESPAPFRRQAVAHMVSYEKTTDGLVYPQRQRTRLCISIIELGTDGHEHEYRNKMVLHTAATLEDSLNAAQSEIVEQEIFSFLIKEAGELPSVSTRVSERLIVVDAAQGMTLKFEMIESANTPSQTAQESVQAATCDLIYFVLQVLLLKKHSYFKSLRLGGVRSSASGFSESRQAPPLLRPIIDILQYKTFCNRVKAEIDKMIHALGSVGIASNLRFNPAGETGNDFVKYLSDGPDRRIGGEAVVRIDEQCTIRLTMSSPSSLTTQLSQACIDISSIPQLYQLLVDELERFLLQRIQELGRQLGGDSGGIWFLDLKRCVGRWEGSAVIFKVHVDQEYHIDCQAFRINRQTNKKGENDIYTHDSGEALFTWVESVIMSALEHKSNQ